MHAKSFVLTSIKFLVFEREQLFLFFQGKQTKRLATLGSFIFMLLRFSCMRTFE